MGYIYIQDRSGKKHLQEYIYICYNIIKKKKKIEKKREEKRSILATNIYYFTIYKTLIGPTCMEIGKEYIN
jgi:hypothetical protein